MYMVHRILTVTLFFSTVGFIDATGVHIMCVWVGYDIMCIPEHTVRSWFCQHLQKQWSFVWIFSIGDPKGIKAREEITLFEKNSQNSQVLSF